MNRDPIIPRLVSRLLSPPSSARPGGSGCQLESSSLVPGFLMRCCLPPRYSRAALGAHVISGFVLLWEAPSPLRLFTFSPYCGLLPLPLGDRARVRLGTPATYATPVTHKRKQSVVRMLAHRAPRPLANHQPCASSAITAKSPVRRPRPVVTALCFPRSV